MEPNKIYLQPEVLKLFNHYYVASGKSSQSNDWEMEHWLYKAEEVLFSQPSAEVPPINNLVTIEDYFGVPCLQYLFEHQDFFLGSCFETKAQMKTYLGAEKRVKEGVMSQDKILDMLKRMASDL